MASRSIGGARRTRAAVAICSAVGIVTAARESRAAPIDVVPFASIDVSRFSDQPAGYSELEAGPGAVRDGDPTTGWRIAGDPESEGFIVFDWSPRAPFAIASLRIDLVPADAPVHVDLGLDRGTLQAVDARVARDAAGATLTLSAAPARVMRLRFPGGTRVMSIRAEGSPGGHVAAAGPPTCDADGVHLHVASNGAFAIGVRRALGGGSVDLVRRRLLETDTITDATVRFDTRPAKYDYALTALGSDDAPLAVSVICDGPARARPPGPAAHGVVEGFYGRPWTWAEREKIVRAMGALGLDTYVYAPKNEAKHRDAWREPYDPETLAHFRSLAALGSGVGVRVVYAISPGQDIDPAKQADVDALVAKVASLAAGAGIRDAALLMDDLDAAAHPHGTALGQAHAALATTLLASMRQRDAASRLWFVPTVYAGLAGKLAPGDVDYLAALSALPADVALAWTGDAVTSRELRLADVDAFARIAGRAAKDVWIWDNYPVNDVAIFRHLHARPITGRESLLPTSAGLFSNPMRHALASIPALASYAELALDPAAYADARANGKPLATAALALLLADGDAPPRALADFFGELVFHDTIWPDTPASPGLMAAIAAYAASHGGRAEAADLATRLARLALVDVDLRRELDDQALSDELDAHARVASAVARVALDALTGDRADHFGDAPSAAAARQLAGCAWISVNPPTWASLQNAVLPLIPKIDTSACGDGGDPLAGADVRYAVIGQPWSLPLTDVEREAGATWSLVDSAGAAIGDDGVIRWTPARLGRFRLVALRIGDAGTAARAFDVVVVEQLPPSAAPPSSGCACAITTAASAVPVAGGAVLLGLLALRLRVRRSTSTSTSTRAPR